VAHITLAGYRAACFLDDRRQAWGVYDGERDCERI